MNTEDTMRKRFWDLAAERERILAMSAGARSQREALQTEIAQREKAMEPLNASIREIERPLYDIDQERAMLARALGGRTGPKSGA